MQQNNNTESDSSDIEFVGDPEIQTLSHSDFVLSDSDFVEREINW